LQCMSPRACRHHHWQDGQQARCGYHFVEASSDVHRMMWTDLVGDAIRLAQRKTGAKLSIPIHASLSRLLTLADRNHATILATAYGKPFSVKGFGNMVSTAIRDAGLPRRCKPHGLRKAAARRLAEAGCSTSEIMAITGHKTLAEVERYTRAAEQEHLARQAIQRQSEKRSGKLELDEVANSIDELSKFNGLISGLALPREAREVSKINDLPKGLGAEYPIGFHSVSERLPKPTALLLRPRLVSTSRGTSGN
jgi:hypothetical protein